MNKINVAITVNISEPAESFFTNGIKQNAIILRDCLMLTNVVNECYYMNFGKQRDFSQSTWKDYEKWIINDFKETLGKIQLYINVNVFMNEPEIRLAQAHGAKVINHAMGNEYYAFLETVLFKNDEQSSIIRKIKDIDAGWMSPHLYETNKTMFEVLYDAPAYVAPFIWSPRFLEHHIKELSSKGLPEKYIPSGKSQKRICAFEPNVQMNKTSVFPVLIGEKHFAKYPNEIEKYSIFGTNQIKNKKNFIKFASGLNIYQNKKMFFEARYPIAWALTKHTDILLSHQQDLGLNYLYFDAAWMGYPVVHNAEFVPELGWYYPRFDDEKAVNQLHEVIQVFDTVPGYREEYIKKSREYISKFLPEHPRNVKGYNDLIIELFENK